MHSRRLLLSLSLLGLACSSDGLGPIAPGKFAEVSAGFLFTCGLTSEGVGVCWGDNAVGQLGNGEVSTIDSQPTSVLGPFLFTRIATGDRQSCGIVPGGAAYCWGVSDEGALGSDTSTRSPVPIPVSGDLTFKAITAGLNYTCGVTTAGAAYCWGQNDVGRLGSDTVNALTPILVLGGHVFTSISAGRYHTCAIASNQSAYCWGAGRVGELGNGDSVDSATPVLVSGGLHFKAIAGGWGHTCAITTTGVAYCWGQSIDGQVGNGSFNYQYLPTPVSGNHTFISISAGIHHSCGAATSGEVFCWGSNESAQLGGTAGQTCNNAPTPYPCSSTPIAVSGGHQFESVSAGAFHTCAIARGGGAFCWGANSRGAIGNGQTGDPVAAPYEVPEPLIPPPPGGP